MILHITQQRDWEAAQKAGVYRGDTLASEGFIHCSTSQQVVTVANTFYRGQAGLVLLRIDPALVAPEIRWEEGAPGQRFPHIYGPLNLDAVVAVIDFPPQPDGTFVLPAGVD